MTGRPADSSSSVKQVEHVYATCSVDTGAGCCRIHRNLKSSLSLGQYFSIAQLHPRNRQISRLRAAGSDSEDVVACTLAGSPAPLEDSVDIKIISVVGVHNDPVIMVSRCVHRCRFGWGSQLILYRTRGAVNQVNRNIIVPAANANFVLRPSRARLRPHLIGE